MKLKFYEQHQLYIDPGEKPPIISSTVYNNKLTVMVSRIIDTIPVGNNKVQLQIEHDMFTQKWCNGGGYFKPEMVL